MEQQPDHESLERLIRISRTSLETATIIVDEQVKIGVSYSVIVPNPRVIRDMVI